MHWCYTANNPTEDTYRLLSALHLVNNTIVYHWFQTERGANGTPHVQGTIGFTTRRAMSTVSGILQCRPHLEPTRGTPRQACDYVSKEDTRIDGPSLQHGDPPVTANGQGRRNDLLTVKHQIDSGVPVLSIAENDEHFGTVIANERSLQAYAHHKSSPRTHRTRCVVFHGSPGSYKSYSASRAKNRYHVVRPTGKNGSLWFDGYLPDVHDTVVFDDFYGWIPYSLLLELLDRFQCHVQRKGGVVEFKPKLVVITSNSAPDAWYKYDQNNMVYEALYRRIDLIFKHEITEAPNGDIPIGEIVVTPDKGSVDQHPLSFAIGPNNVLNAENLNLEDDASSSLAIDDLFE